MEVRGQHNDLAVLNPGKIPVSVEQEVGWVGPRAGLDVFGKIAWLSRDSNPVQSSSQPSRYADYAIPAHDSVTLAD
jgi:hypothetical protein